MHTSVEIRRHETDPPEAVVETGDDVIKLRNIHTPKQFNWQVSNDSNPLNLN